MNLMMQDKLLKMKWKKKIFALWSQYHLFLPLRFLKVNSQTFMFTCVQVLTKPRICLWMTFLLVFDERSKTSRMLKKRLLEISRYVVVMQHFAGWLWFSWNEWYKCMFLFQIMTAALTMRVPIGVLDQIS